MRYGIRIVMNDVVAWNLVDEELVGLVHAALIRRLHSNLSGKIIVIYNGIGTEYDLAFELFHG